jgi:hypothetical protein
LATCHVGQQFSSPNGVSDMRRLRAKSDVPIPWQILRFCHRLDDHIDGEQMCQPACDEVTKRGQAMAIGREIERHIETVASLPVAFRCCFAQEFNPGCRL